MTKKNWIHVFGFVFGTVAVSFVFVLVWDVISASAQEDPAIAEPVSVDRVLMSPAAQQSRVQSLMASTSLEAADAVIEDLRHQDAQEIVSWLRIIYRDLERIRGLK